MRRGIKRAAIPAAFALICIAYATDLNSAPSAPGSLHFESVSGQDGIIEGAFSGVVTDPGDTVKMQIYLHPNNTAYAFVPDGESALLESGVTATVNLILRSGTGYSWYARAVDSAGNASSWALGGAFFVSGVSANVNNPPNPPASPGVFKSDGTSASPATNEIAVVFKATVTDADGDNVKLEVRVMPAGAVYTGPLVASGSTASVPVDLAPGSYTWEARAIDSKDAASTVATGPAFEIVTTTPVNRPPDAAGSMSQLKNDETTMITVGAATSESVVKCAATLSDPDGDKTKLQVEFRPTSEAFTGISTAESALVDSGTSAIIAISNLASGTYHWRARAVDSAGASSEWTVFGGNADDATDVRVDLSAGVPSAPSSLRFVSLSGQEATFSGIVSDPGDTVKLQIEAKPNGAYNGVPDGESALVTSGYAATARTIVQYGTSYNWRARAVDSVGNASAWVLGGAFMVEAVVVNNPPDPPSPGVYKSDGTSASPATNETVVVFKATLTDTDGDNVRVEVRILPDGPVYTSPPVASGTVASVTVTLPPGSYTWEARAIDSHGDASEIAIGLDFTIDTTPPTISAITASPASGAAPLEVKFGATVIADAAVTSYAWDFDGNGTYDFQSATSAAATRKYTMPGTYCARLRVMDIAGNTVTATVTVTVAPAPSPAASLSADVTSGSAPLTVHFSANVPDAASAVAYQWDFDGDGNWDASTDGGNATRVYVAPGTWNASLLIVYENATSTLLGVSPITVGEPIGGLSSVKIVRVYVDANSNGRRDSEETILASSDSGLQEATVTAQAGQSVGFQAQVDLPSGVEADLFEWSFTGGSVQFSSSTSATATYRYDSEGLYTVKLTLTDKVSATGEKRSQVGTTTAVEVAPATAANARVYFVNSLKSGASISGNHFVFNINAVPAAVFDFTTAKVQYCYGGRWVDAPSIGMASAPPSARITVNIEGLIADSALIADTAYSWRCLIATVSGATIASTDAGQQGSIVLTPVAARGDIETSTHGPPVLEVKLDENAEVAATLLGEEVVTIPQGGVPRPATDAALRLVARTVEFNPAFTSVAVINGSDVNIMPGEYREFHVEDDNGVLFRLLKPARVRIYYDDADGNGIVDGTTTPTSDLKLFRFVGGRWMELEETERNPGEKWVEATTPGFSFFSLGALDTTAGMSATTGCSFQARSGGAGGWAWIVILPLLAAAWGARRIVR